MCHMSSSSQTQWNEGTSSAWLNVVEAGWTDPWTEQYLNTGKGNIRCAEPPLYLECSVECHRGKKKWDFKLNATRALPVLLCWMRKRKGRSRVISSTAMRENITAAKRGGEMDKQVSVSAKFSCNLKFWTQTTLCAIQVLSKIIKVSLFFTPQGHQCCIYHCLHYSEQLICFYFILIVPCSINALKLHFLWLSVLYFFTFECWGWVKTNMVPLLILTFQTCILSGVSGLGLQLCLKHNSVLLQLGSFFFWCCSGHRCVSW